MIAYPSTGLVGDSGVSLAKLYVHNSLAGRPVVIEVARPEDEEATATEDVLLRRSARSCMHGADCLDGRGEFHDEAQLPLCRPLQWPTAGNHSFHGHASVRGVFPTDTKTRAHRKPCHDQILPDGQ